VLFEAPFLFCTVLVAVAGDGFLRIFYFYVRSYFRRKYVITTEWGITTKY
jgi:hypothetical protein